MSIILIGYSDHAFSVIEAVYSVTKNKIFGYFDLEEKKNNPYNLKYLGSEKDAKLLEKFKQYSFFVAIGDNQKRENIINKLKMNNLSIVNVFHKSSIVSKNSILGKGIFVSSGAIINSCSNIGSGVIINTGCIIEHDNIIGDYCHIGPGVVLLGAVRVGANSLIGAGSVIRKYVKIGKNVKIGEGSIIIKDVTDNSVVVGLHKWSS